MGMIEVDETAFLNAQKTSEIVKKMLTHPEARRKVLEAHKLVDPNVSVPQLDEADRVEKKIDAVETRVTEALKKIEDRDAERDKTRRQRKLESDFAAGRAALKGKGYNEEGIKKIEELMEAKGIVSHEDASIIFDKLNPAPPPVTSSSFGPAYNFFDLPETGQEDTKRLLESKGEDGRALNNLIRAGLAEVRGGR
jgi:hypothetical protein